MSLLFYRFFLGAYHLGIRLVSLWNPKAALWVKGRKEFPRVATVPGRFTYWMHCASLGEFEQGRPLIEQCRKDHPDANIVLSFFSSSGYRAAKNFPGADQVIYLPRDSKANARKLVALINPSIVLWIKYEYWYYYLAELKRRKIPVMLISGVYRKNMVFFKWYGSLW